ncbi:hypothetical protein [Sedimenticola hydrogenitrophicus]|uniref:hypothetical protein n=1 Tax=Sedimenticola hydrogenitrophicus TaxID=2967975 RepID=UPI0023AE8A46|nr:hypothetical protein [Sedimenticola hydrogenitrophicus]
MATPNYRLVFSGKLRKGFKHHEVQQSLAQLLKIPLDQAGHLIQGSRFRINKTLEKSKAERLLEKVRARGAECSIEPSGPLAKLGEAKPSGRASGSTAASAQPDPVAPPEVSPEASPEASRVPGRPELAADDERTRPLSTVSPEAADEDIVLATPAIRRSAYKSDDDSENVGTFFQRSTTVETHDRAFREKRLRLVLLAGLLGVAAVAVLWLMWNESSAPVATATPVIPATPADLRRAETGRRLEQLNRSIKVWMIQYGSGFNPAQVTLERLQQDLDIGQQEMLDGWGTALRFEPEPGKYRVISAGPDKSFDTPDDLKRETVMK